jgi:hypothetical protein
MVPSGIRFCEIKMGCPLVEEVGVHELGIKNKLLKVGDGRHVDKQVGRKDGNILIIKGAIVIVGVAGEVVGFIGGTRFVDEFKVKFRQLQEIVGNMLADFLGVPVIFQV